MSTSPHTSPDPLSYPDPGLPSFQNTNIIHQIFLDIGKGPLSNFPSWIENTKVTRRLNPGYSYQLWDDRLTNLFIDTYYPQYKTLINDFPHKFYLIDFVRYLILDHYGGIYLDLDVRSKRPLPEKAKTILGSSYYKPEKVNNNIKSQLKNTVQIESKTVQENALKEIKKNNYHQINTFKDIVELAGEEKEVELKYDLERNVKLVRFDKNKIDISFNEKLHKNFIKVLSEKLFKWTGERWIISLSRNENAKTIYEKNLEEKSELLTRESKNEVTKKLQSIFPDAKLIDVNGENDD